ncbi:MAG TPA: septation ring formation regulator EzrA, partial [Niallia sp.]|nr:septation ring formation regulator EzrA [Niallia sp.]
QEKIDLLYDLLEKEVIARNYCNTNIESAKTIMEEIQNGNSRLQVEVELLQKNYNLTGDDIELKFKLEKKLHMLYKQFEVLEHKLMTDSTAHTLLSEELRELKQQLEMASQEQSDLFERLHALRKDEVISHEKIKELSIQVTDALRRVANSNLPGVTEEYNQLVSNAKTSITKVKAKLDIAPLDMFEVKKLVEEAEEHVIALVNTTLELVETVYLAEKIIQYGNRYRKRYPQVHAGLLEAESAFRKYQYDEALRAAAVAIEEVEPNYSTKIETWSREWEEDSK